MFYRFFIVFLAGSLAVSAVSAKLPPEVSKALRQMGVPENSVSLYVREIGAERPLIEHRAYEPMNPASTMKIITTLVALDVLTPQYAWKTEFLSPGVARDGVLSAPLVIRGSGDPKFTWENLQTAVNALRRQGIREIRSDVLLDRTRFAAVKYDTTSFDGQSLRPYNVPPDALLYNFKSVGFNFSLRPTGEIAITTDGPAPDGLTIVNQLKPGRGECGDWKAKLNANFESRGNSARASFTGVYPIDCGTREWFVSLFDHNGLLAGTFARMWRDAGGRWGGIMRDGKTPPNSRLLHAHLSPPLSTMVTDINKFSNNVMARQLLLTFDSQVMDSPGRADRGGIAIKEWAKLRRIDVPDLVVENGSGLSRAERVSAKSLASLLEYGLTSTYATDFVKSLPIAATDGTLSRRFSNAAAQGNAYLKTGTLTGVIALAGYLRLPGNRPFLFVSIMNHPNANGATDALDRAVDWVFQTVQ
jgi:serine-type D-Ala-D-Ala carboxypeptidase/endopeptidase (penicillin-binding protein 4)